MTPIRGMRLVHGMSIDILRAAFCEYFGVRPEHAEILVVLYDRAGDRVPTREMQKLLSSHRPPTRQAIYERVRLLREIMDAESLDSGGQLDELGYALTEAGLEECRKALHATAEALLKNGPLTTLAGRNVEAIRRGEPESPSLRTACRGRH